MSVYVCGTAACDFSICVFCPCLQNDGYTLSSVSSYQSSASGEAHNYVPDGGEAGNLPLYIPLGVWKFTVSTPYF